MNNAPVFPGKDRRGLVKWEGHAVQAWHYRIMPSQPMIQWTNVRVGTLNDSRYEFAVTQDRSRGTGNCYGYFWSQGELLFFYTGKSVLDEGAAITYTPAARIAA